MNTLLPSAANGDAGKPYSQGDSSECLWKVYTCLLRRAELRHGQTWPHPSYLWMRYLCCSLPSGLVLQLVQWCCPSHRRYNRTAGLLLLLGLRVGMAILRGTQAFRNALASSGHFWRPMAEHGLHKTLYNVFLPYNQPKPGEQPLLHLGVHPWRNSDPRLSFIWAILFNHPSWKSRAG